MTGILKSVFMLSLVVYTCYNFTEQVTPTTTLHNHGQVSQVMLATIYAYDQLGRVTTENIKINQEDEITLAACKYIGLGEQVAKYLHDRSSGTHDPLQGLVFSFFTFSTDL